MIMVVAGIIGAMGLVCIISRRTLLGTLLGVQMLVLGASMTLVLAGASSGARVNGHVFGFLIALGGVGQLVAGYALAVRLFYLKDKNDIEELRSLKQ
ncbi:MAG: NADH-quinone oxidoreductase subunit K [Oligoflexia bacterium]|nr:NADH-quinone oxidoreductase subunit K [Oligoflexia bacterium]